MNLAILETRKIGLEDVKRVILDAIDHDMKNQLTLLAPKKLTN